MEYAAGGGRTPPAMHGGHRTRHAKVDRGMKKLVVVTLALAVAAFAMLSAGVWAKILRHGRMTRSRPMYGRHSRYCQPASGCR